MWIDLQNGRVWASRPRNVKPSILLKHHTKIALYMCDYAFAIQNMHCTIMRLYDKICRRNSSTASSLSRRLESTTRDCWIPCNLNMMASFTFPQIPNFSRAFNTCIIANKLHVYFYIEQKAVRFFCREIDLLNVLVKFRRVAQLVNHIEKFYSDTFWLMAALTKTFTDLSLINHSHKTSSIETFMPNSTLSSDMNPQYTTERALYIVHSYMTVERNEIQHTTPNLLSQSPKTQT